MHARDQKTQPGTPPPEVLCAPPLSPTRALSGYTAPRLLREVRTTLPMTSTSSKRTARYKTYTPSLSGTAAQIRREEQERDQMHSQGRVCCSILDAVFHASGRCVVVGGTAVVQLFCTAVQLWYRCLNGSTAVVHVEHCSTDVLYGGAAGGGGEDAPRSRRVQGQAGTTLSRYNAL
eukprot:2229019-Rhodomonas_salina.1